MRVFFRYKPGWIKYFDKTTGLGSDRITERKFWTGLGFPKCPICSILLDSQNITFVPILVITEAKKAHFFVCKQTGFVQQTLRDFVERTLTRVSSHSVKNVTRVESSHHLSQRDSC